MTDDPTWFFRVPKPEPRPITPTAGEKDSWLDAATQRAKDPDPRDLAYIQAYVDRRSRRRWRRFRRDYKHIGKIIQELGLNPEDARWLL